MSAISGIDIALWDLKGMLLYFPFFITTPLSTNFVISLFCPTFDLYTFWLDMVIRLTMRGSPADEAERGVIPANHWEIVL